MTTSAVITLDFATRWTNIALWGVVKMNTSHGWFRAEYVSGSERVTSAGWAYDFLIFSSDLPPPLTLADINNALLIAPFVQALDPCLPDLGNCWSAIPELPSGTPATELAVIVGPNDCGKWCMYRTPAADHDQYWVP